jgi:hypothetical protein
VFEDPSGQATIADVRAQAAAGNFKPHDKATLNAGYSRSVFWLKIDLQYRPTNPRRNAPGCWSWRIRRSITLTSTCRCSGNYRLVRADRRCLAVRQPRDPSEQLPVQSELHPGQTQTLYLRLQSEGSIQAPVTLWSSTAYLEDQPVRLYVLGLIYGVLLGMLVYNLFIYLSVRDTSYLYYIVYIASFGLYQLSVNGAAVSISGRTTRGGPTPRRRFSSVAPGCSAASSPAASCRRPPTAAGSTACCWHWWRSALVVGCR